VLCISLLAAPRNFQEGIFKSQRLVVQKPGNLYLVNQIFLCRHGAEKFAGSDIHSQARRTPNRRATPNFGINPDDLTIVESTMSTHPV
jgi:hypothetical protein